MQCCRKDTDFRQRRPDGKGGWIWDLKGVRLVPSHLPAWIDKPFVFVVEGERDADALWDWGVPATTNPMGAGKWRQEYNEFFRDKVVFLIPDRDKAGVDHVKKIASALSGIAKAVVVVHLPP